MSTKTPVNKVRNDLSTNDGFQFPVGHATLRGKGALPERMRPGSQVGWMLAVLLFNELTDPGSIRSLKRTLKGTHRGNSRALGGFIIRREQWRQEGREMEKEQGHLTKLASRGKSFPLPISASPF